jgi:DHA1 family bicyclomycin/chloramphenicol resistance-like MFS transporter
MVAPATGSVLIHWFGWRSVHWVLALGGCLLLAITWAGVAESKLATIAIPEPTNQDGAVQLWHDTGFVRIALANALSYGAIFAYIAGSPVVIIGQMGFSSAVFAGVFASTAAALAAGAWTSGRLSRRGVSAMTLLDRSLLVAAAATVILAGVTLYGVMSGAVIIPLLLVTLYTRGIIAPNLQHIAIDRQRERAGAASAAVGVSQLLSGALASAVVAFLLQSFGPSSLAVVMVLLAGGALIVWHWTSL